MSLKRFRTLTDREYETMVLVVRGKPNKMIADELGIALRTVKHHRAEIMRKLQVPSLAELVWLATKCEVI